MELWVVAEVDDGDLFGWDGQQIHQVVFRRLRIGRDRVGLPHCPAYLAVVIAAALRREEFRVQQERQIVHGDDRAPAAPQRRDEVGRVQEVEAVRRGFDGECEGFEAVVRGGPAVYATGARGEGLRVSPAVKVDVLVLGAKRGQIGGEMPDVFRDAAAGVIGEPNVETETHGAIISDGRQVTRPVTLFRLCLKPCALYNLRAEERAMDIEQLSKTTQWLDDERRKDKQEMAALHERVTGLAAENASLQRKVQQLESDLATSTATLQRLAKIDDILDGYRKEMARQVEELEQRRSDAAREDERLRKVEREGINKSLAELRKGIENIARLEREAQARKDEENRLSRLVAELQNKVSEFNRYLDERLRSIAVVEEGRRQDAKRITELQTELIDLRKRLDENRGKLDVVEDVARRVDARLGELFIAETERRNMQTQWLDAQAIVQAERDRAWNDMQIKVDSAVKSIEEYARKVDQYAETNRDLKRSADEFKQMTEFMERRITEAAEIQRLAGERFRQDWAAFLADDQKRWTTHMLLRDEQWREHDRLNIKQLERLEALEEQAGELLDAVRHMQALDANRLQSLLTLVREMVAEYEQQFAKVR